MTITIASAILVSSVLTAAKSIAITSTDYWYYYYVENSVSIFMIL